MRSKSFRELINETLEDFRNYAINNNVTFMYGSVVFGSKILFFISCIIGKSSFKAFKYYDFIGFAFIGLGIYFLVFVNKFLFLFMIYYSYIFLRVGYEI